MRSYNTELMLSDELAKVLGAIVAEKQREFDQIIALRDAEFKVFRAECTAMLREALDAIDAMKASVRDGKDGEPGAIGPQGERGEPGEQGPIGEKGDPGEHGADGAHGERGAQGPEGQQGRDGRDGLPGVPGVPGERGKDGRDGIDGKDGAGFDSWAVEHDGARAVTFVAGSGERKKQFTITLPIPIFQGKWEARLYELGDEVSHGGNVFRALRTTEEKPGPMSKDWMVATNRGRDGRDGKDGERGPEGKEGRPGRDLTQIGFDGKKW